MTSNVQLTLQEAKLLSLLSSYLHDLGYFAEIIEGKEKTLENIARKMVDAFPEGKWSTEEYGTFGEILQRQKEEQCLIEEKKI